VLSKITAKVAELLYPADPAELLQVAEFDCRVEKSVERRRKRLQRDAAQQQSVQSRVRRPTG
jgi:hypothetical protein